VTTSRVRIQNIERRIIEAADARGIKLSPAQFRWNADKPIGIHDHAIPLELRAGFPWIKAVWPRLVLHDGQDVDTRECVAIIRRIVAELR
jgi:hypothetical protein